MSADRRELIKTDGTVIQLPPRPHSLAEIRKLIGCEGLDSFMLKDRKHVCMIDDVGALDHLPVNREATKLYHAICRPVTDWEIHGNAVIVPDSDFE